MKRPTLDKKRLNELVINVIGYHDYACGSWDIDLVEKSIKHGWRAALNAMDAGKPRKRYDTETIETLEMVRDWLAGNDIAQVAVEKVVDRALTRLRPATKEGGS